ncbi:MAG: hypothetical protein LBM28_07045, partial [Oscillospiraceae bacterium]|jgi:hypothetical protein|nr:hypothetical protein [Oscillospiraceae bacterium]
MIGTYWGGASVGAAIYVYFYDGKQITDEIRVYNFQMYYDILDQENNKQIGLVPGEGDFYDFVVSDKVCPWDDANQNWNLAEFIPNGGDINEYIGSLLEEFGEN